MDGRTADPMEMLIERALISRGLWYKTDHGGGNEAGLDFYLPGLDVHIEVKQFHSERSNEQLSRAPNVILAQGEGAVNFLAHLIANCPVSP